MHRRLRTLLHQAEGRSGVVVAVSADVRGFTSFARMAESSEAVIFLRRVYIRMLDDYFPQHSFFKPTGDGLLILRAFDEGSIEQVVNETVDASLRLVRDFPTICSDDPMVNFPTPEKLGVGIARGAVTALVSGRQTLDYSGRPLNLATRLMDAARPAGVVFDEALGFPLLDEALVPRFTRAAVYLRGLAEREPLTIYHSSETVIEQRHLVPVGKVNWKSEPPETLTLKELEFRGLYFQRLSQVPTDTKGIEIQVASPAVMKSGAKHPTMKTLRTLHPKFIDDGGNPVASIDYRPTVGVLKAAGVKSTWKVTVTVRYPT
ncbi:MAG TPA: adenylate/guanylate cyclase domain-containing protein [Thermoleophilia bacterium]|nr:adenylate/guanylate cyclase domain-containing protein [Thermoleophilia bacterium]